jgi:hypothetical protein
MLSRKRKAEEPDDVSQPISLLLASFLDWRDACGRAYRVVHKIELSPARAVLRVGKFDRATRGALRQLEALLNERETYTIGSCECVMRDRAVAITLVKRATASDAAVKRLRRAAEEAVAATPGRVPLKQPVPAQDRPVLEETVHRVLLALGASDGEPPHWHMTELPSEYHVHFPIQNTVGERALAACGTDASHVDFDAAELVAVVPKQAPDILF